MRTDCTVRAWPPCPFMVTHPHHDAPSFYVESVPEQCMTMAIYREARGEPEDTMAGVGYVVLNRTGHVNYPNTVCGVVTQANHDKHQRPYSCQFSWACHLPAGKIDATAYAHANRIALGVLSGAVPNPVGHALNFSELATASRVSKGNPYRKRIGHLIFTGPRMAHSRSELAMVSNASLPIPTDK
jgi:spore germination cell wall hydrolase CwlJ-like protein